jgi:hypothetical protein
MSSLVKTALVIAGALALLGLGGAAQARSTPHDPSPNGVFSHNFDAWSRTQSASIDRLVDRLQQAALGQSSGR